MSSSVNLSNLRLTVNSMHDRAEEPSAAASTSKTPNRRSTRKRKSRRVPDESETEGASSRPARKKAKTRGRPRRERCSPEPDEEGGENEGKKWEPGRDRGEKKKKHLIDAAYDILNVDRSLIHDDFPSSPPSPDYFYNVDKHPDEDARAELAERVRDIPGCEHYTSRQVYAYFGNMRFKTREGHVPKAMRRLQEDGRLPGEHFGDTRAIPSIGESSRASRPDRAALSKEAPNALPNVSVVSQLDTLLKSHPSLTYEDAARWAATLGGGIISINPDDILTYALLKQASTTQRPLDAERHSEDPGEDDGSRERAITPVDLENTFMRPLFIGSPSQSASEAEVSLVTA
ncbi:hypothetical protein BD310DRAFT_162210 [Dichomitus squalens]|uniref:Uncharacterized protein n=1 Tax=Dichomitus squalens TaxID=114155 RepID=A0A4Q9PIG4_9APHY|nr:hypothetical protein BD310DRAFT_162210 [Dichomitus squalens]